MSFTRRQILKASAASLVALGGSKARAAATSRPVRIGYTLSATGPRAFGAAITQAPNYALWAERLNAKGGLLVKDHGRRRIEYVSADDESDPQVAARFYERLCTEDRVDLLLSPWGTHIAFSVAPVASKHGYCMIGPTTMSASTEKKPLPGFYILSAGPTAVMGAVVDLLIELRKQGQVNTIAMAYNADAMGAELYKAFTQLESRGNLKIIATRWYPRSANNFAPLLTELRALRPDAFIGLTYPDDNVAITAQAKTMRWDPRVFFTGVGTAYPTYRDALGGAEGVMGIAGWNPKVKFPGAREYFDAHLSSKKREPDRWGSAFTWASLEILERCVAEVGLDQSSIQQMLDSGTTFSTIIGPVQFQKGQNIKTPAMIGQWQKGEFEIIWPPSRATAEAKIPKPSWS